MAAAAVVAVVVSLGAASGASAGTLCVGLPSCPGGTVAASVQTALNAAGSLTGPDTVMIGPGTFDSADSDGFVYSPGSATNNAVTVVGAGRTATVLRAPIANSGSSVLQGSAPIALSDLRIVGTSSDARNGVFLSDGDSAVRVDIETGADRADGVLVLPGDSASFADGTVSSPGGKSVVNLGTLTVTDSRLSGDVGLTVDADATLTVRRTAVLATSVALRSFANSTTTLDDVLLASSRVGAEMVSNGGTTTRLTGFHVTIAGRPGASIGVRLQPSDYLDAANLTLRDSVLAGFPVAYDIPPTGGNSDITTDWLDRTGAVVDESFSVTNVRQETHTTTDDPRFVAGDDFHLGANSPAIDAGDPAATVPGDASATDADGNPRVADGDGDGTPRRDLGAFEFVPHPPVAAAAATPASVLVGADATFDGTGSSDPDPGDVLTYSWSFDDGTTANGATVSHAFATAGSHTGALTVTDLSHRAAFAFAVVGVTTPPAPAPAQRSCRVPKLKGRTLKAAKVSLTKAGCGLGKVRRRHSRTVRRNRVSAQSPKAGTARAPGARVALTISLGR
jgi:hypothetical protein